MATQARGRLAFALALFVGACIPTTSSGPPSSPVSSSGNPAQFAYDGPGRELIGRDVRALLPTRIIEASTTAGSASTPRATLVRWWTDQCPFCERSLPAIETLRTRYARQGLRTIAVYHPKPPRAVDDAFVESAADRLGYHGTIAVDERWDALNAIWLHAGSREATSVSILLDADGRVVWVHPGPDLHPSNEPEFAAQNADYERIEAAIRALCPASR